MHSVSSTTRHWATGRSVSLSLVLLLGSLLGPGSQVSGQEKGEHLFVEAKDIKTETCLTCHPKKEAKFVHTAVGMGCENCHQAVSENSKTRITLIATGRELCAMCHEAGKEPVQHGPYMNGQCLTCHDPHSSEFKAQTRAAANSLCLACHGVQAATSDPVNLFNGQNISKADFEAIPKIELDPRLRFGHPFFTHPVAEIPDPLRGGEKMSCLSCHSPHASTIQKLQVAVKGKDLCDACHRANDERLEAKRKSQAQTQQQSQGRSNPSTPPGEKVKQ